MTRSSSTPSSTTHNTSSSDFPASLTLQTSISVQPKTTGSKKKKAKSDIQEQVERVNGEIGSIQSDVTSRHNLKHERFLVKLDVKKDYHCEMKKYKYLRKETKDAEICLCETDVQVHEAQALALDKEAEMWHLKIQFHQMMQSGSTASASDS
ncbi:hypothetical protein BDR06DRAFT_1009895 [Suillus hirtellus]|nr:hypothetical protein BDR06DRAFT_1009895 [Suillus hirtellus]